MTAQASQFSRGMPLILPKLRVNCYFTSLSSHHGLGAHQDACGEGRVLPGRLIPGDSNVVPFSGFRTLLGGPWDLVTRVISEVITVVIAYNPN